MFLQESFESRPLVKVFLHKHLLQDVFLDVVHLECTLKNLFDKPHLVEEDSQFSSQFLQKVVLPLAVVFQAMVEELDEDVSRPFELEDLSIWAKQNHVL